MNQRNRSGSRAIKTRGEMSRLVQEIAGLKVDEKLLLADMERELRAARDRYEVRLRWLTQMLEERTATARAWAESNPAEFGWRRSVDFGHGVAGFRTGPPRLQTVSRCQWDRVLKSLRELRWGAPYIRVKEEINKEQIIADVGAGKLAEPELRQAGARVVRDELFFVEPRLTRPRLRRTVA